MNKSQHIKISKFLSYILRHKPEAIELRLDSDGWADISTLIHLSNEKGQKLDLAMLHNVVDLSPKKRFSISPDGMRIRASQGHSLKQVDIKFEEKIPPEILYHGTAHYFLESIIEQGLNAKERQYVHLSIDKEMAIQVGMRHGTPVVLKINALKLYHQGVKFYQADNDIWLTKFISPAQIIQDE